MRLLEYCELPARKGEVSRTGCHVNIATDVSTANAANRVEFLTPYWQRLQGAHLSLTMVP